MWLILWHTGTKDAWALYLGRSERDCVVGDLRLKLG
jgi:hypothetical protein